MFTDSRRFNWVSCASARHAPQAATSLPLWSFPRRRPPFLWITDVKDQRLHGTYYPCRIAVAMSLLSDAPTSANRRCSISLVGQKISITSKNHRPPAIASTGILTDARSQFIFVDTPGFQTRHTNRLNSAMNRIVTQSLRDVDAVIFVIEAMRFDDRDKMVVKLLPGDRPVILADQQGRPDDRQIADASLSRKNGKGVAFRRDRSGKRGAGNTAIGADRHDTAIFAAKPAIVR